MRSSFNSWSLISSKYSQNRPKKPLFSSSTYIPTKFYQHLPQWEEITSDPEVLSIVKCYQIDFH